MNSKALVLHSGGQDSTTCLYWALKKFDQVFAMSFYYGQRHEVELECAKSLCQKLNVPHTIIDMSFIASLSENALTHKDLALKMVGPYKDLPNTFVPGRNLFFLSAAAAFAAPRGIVNLVTGVCQTDYSGYPDCRQNFIDSLKGTLKEALELELQIHTPLMFLTKAETFALAQELECLKSVIEDSHTCYNGDRTNKHAWGYGCGVCPACELRARGYEGFQKLKT